MLASFQVRTPFHSHTRCHQRLLPTASFPLQTQARLRRANRNYWAQLERDRHALLVDRTQWTDEELVERLSRWLESGEQAAFPSERVSDPQPEYAPELVLFADEEVVDEKLRQITLAVQDYRDYLLRHDANAEFYAV